MWKQCNKSLEYRPRRLAGELLVDNRLAQSLEGTPRVPPTMGYCAVLFYKRAQMLVFKQMRVRVLVVRHPHILQLLPMKRRADALV